jgi:hypothetical protein
LTYQKINKIEKEKLRIDDKYYLIDIGESFRICDDNYPYGTVFTYSKSRFTIIEAYTSFLNKIAENEVSIPDSFKKIK